MIANLTNRQVQLLVSADNDASLGFNYVSDLATGILPVTLENVRNTRRVLDAATSSLTALESLLAGNPEPKRGD